MWNGKNKDVREEREPGRENGEDRGRITAAVVTKQRRFSAAVSIDSQTTLLSWSRTAMNRPFTLPTEAAVLV